MSLPSHYFVPPAESLGDLFFRRPPVILGVTNPFFAKTLQHWPHIIRIGEMGGLGKKVLVTHISSL